MTQHWWDRFRFGRSDILETPPSPEYVAGVLESDRIRPQPFNPLMSERNREQMRQLHLNNSPEEQEKLREELHRLGLLHLVNNPREEEEKIKAYIETLKRDISEGMAIPLTTLFGSNNSTEEQSLIQDMINAQNERAMIRESNRLAVENPSERSLIPRPNQNTIDEFMSSMRELSHSMVPLAEVIAEAVAPLVDTLLPIMNVTRNGVLEYIEAAHLRTIPGIYYDGVDEEYIIFFGGGQNQDNDVRAQWDFIYTISHGIHKLKEKGCDASRFNIFTNRRLKDVSTHYPHIASSVDVNEFERINHRDEVNCWIIDDNLPDVIVIKPVPVVPPGTSRIPLMVAITGILNSGGVVRQRTREISLDDLGNEINTVTGIANRRSTATIGSAIIEGPRVEGSVLDGPVVRSGPFTVVPSGTMEVQGGRGTVGTIDIHAETPKMKLEREMREAISKLKIVDRECWLCGNSINYKECCEANPSMIHKEVSALWNNTIAKIACCSCTDKLMNLINLQSQYDVVNIIVFKETKTKYIVAEDRFVNYSKIYRVKIEFSNTTCCSFTRIQFENLMKFKIVDFPIELEDDVLEPEVEKVNRSDCEAMIT